MAILLKVKNAQAFQEKINSLLADNSIGEKNDVWVIEKFSNSPYYTLYTPKGKWNSKAWFKVCPDDIRKTFNEMKKNSYNLIFRLHGTKGDEMSRELYGFYHSRFVDFLLVNMIGDIKELSITASLEDIKKLDRFKNYDWR